MGCTLKRYGLRSIRKKRIVICQEVGLQKLWMEKCCCNNVLTLFIRELDRLGYETLGNLVGDLMLGKQIEAMKGNFQSSGRNTAQLEGHYDFYKNIDVEDMLKEDMKRYHPKTARCFVSYFGRDSDIFFEANSGVELFKLKPHKIMDLTIDKKSCSLLLFRIQYERRSRFSQENN
jgi:hypothetical protein